MYNIEMKVRFAMLNKNNKQLNGFSTMTTEELFLVNGGSDYSKIDFSIKKEPTIEDMVKKFIPLPKNVSFSTQGITYTTKDFSVSLSVKPSSASVSFGFKF